MVAVAVAVKARAAVGRQRPAEHPERRQPHHPDRRRCGPGCCCGAGCPGAPVRAAPRGVRRHGINLHMFEALLGLYEATKSEEVWYEINSELTAIDRLFDHNVGYLPESYDENWKPVGNPSGNPGHLFEWASLLSRAVELGADPKFIELGSRNLDLGLKSYNDAVGGLGGVNAGGQPTQMLWWPQCEVIKATATYAILHGRTDLWPYYHKTLGLREEGVLRHARRRLVRRLRARPAARRRRVRRRSTRARSTARSGAAYHQTSMMYDLWRITDPDYKAWPTKR